MVKQLDRRIRELCRAVKAKRPRTVIDHIMEHGHVTTEELQTLYSYDHPPRAVRDVREQGIPIETFKVKSERTGRMIAAYRFGDPSKVKAGRIGGRKAFSKRFKAELVKQSGARCAFTGERLEERYLQIDHRIPYEVLGDEIHDAADLGAYMLIDASSQRAKSWSCEACKNWRTDHDPGVCKTCFWAYPEAYTHVALKQERRLIVTWSAAEVGAYDRLLHIAEEQRTTVHELVRSILSNAIAAR